MVKNNEFKLEVLSALWEKIKTALPAFSGRKKRLSQEIVNLYKYIWRGGAGLKVWGQWEMRADNAEFQGQKNSLIKSTCVGISLGTGMSFLSIRRPLKSFCQKRDEHKDCTTAVASIPPVHTGFPAAFSPSEQQQPGFLPLSSMQVATCSLLNPFVFAMFFVPVLADFLRPDITST